MVDSRPARDGPSSRIQSIRPSRSAQHMIGRGRADPTRAIGRGRRRAARPPPRSARARPGAQGARTASVSRPARAARLTRPRRPAEPRLAAPARTFAPTVRRSASNSASSSRASATLEDMRDQRIEGRPSFGLEHRCDRRVQCRVCREAIDRLGRHGDEAAARGDMRRRRRRFPPLPEPTASSGSSPCWAPVGRCVSLHSPIHKLVLPAHQSNALRSARAAACRTMDPGMTYRSPVADILFSLQTVAGLPEMIGSKLHGDFDWETISSVVERGGTVRHR